MSGRSLVPALPFMASPQAAKAVRVFDRLRLPDVIGQPPLAEATGDWFRDIVRALFGSYDPETHRRAIQEVFLLVPKKNGKSTNAAGVILTAAVVNQRPNAELLLIAPTKEIADISFRQAKGMIQADPDLKATFSISHHIRTIQHRVSGALIQIKAADTDAITGVKAAYILIDETHVFAAKPRAREVFVELRGALAARPDGFLMQISTQSKEPPAGVFRSELNTARRVRDGEQMLPLLPVLYELPAALADEDKWMAPEHMARVNPNLGRSVNVEFLERELGKAQEEGAEALALFASQHANVEIGLGLRTDRWVGADHWLDAAHAGLTLDSLLARADAVVVGIDGGGLDDLLGLAVLGRDRTTRQWMLWGKAWAHPTVLERRKAIAARLRDFAADGDLTIVQTPSGDLDDVAAIVVRVKESGLLPEKNGVGVDQAGIGAIVDTLAERGVTEPCVVGVPQGWRLSAAIKTMERKLVDGSLQHCGQPMMAWVVSNARAEAKGNNTVINKAAAGTAKIDPLVASFNALALMSMNPEGAMSLDAFLNDPVIA